MQYTSLTLDKILNSLIYRTLFYVNIHESYKLSNTVRFFGHPVLVICTSLLLLALLIYNFCMHCVCQCLLNEYTTTAAAAATATATTTTTTTTKKPERTLTCMAL